MGLFPPYIVILIYGTWYLKGSHIYVCVYQTGDGSDNCFCSIKLFFRQHLIQQNIAVIFWGIGGRVTDALRGYIFGGL